MQLKRPDKWIAEFSWRIRGGRVLRQQFPHCALPIQRRTAETVGQSVDFVPAGQCRVRDDGVRQRAIDGKA
jgi:hypothetical protein